MMVGGCLDSMGCLSKYKSFVYPFLKKDPIIYETLSRVRIFIIYILIELLDIN